MARIGAALRMALFMLAAGIGAAAAQDWRCDCSRVVTSCSATVAIEDEMLHITSSTQACALVEYFLDSEYRLTTLYGGFTALPLRRPATPLVRTPLPPPPLPREAPLPGEALPPTAEDRLPPTLATPLPPVRTRVATCRVCYDRAVEAGRRGSPLVGNGGQVDHQCASAAAETRRLLQECGAQASAGTLDYACTTRLMEANNRVAALCN